MTCPNPHCHYHYHHHQQHQYGCMSFLFDLFMVAMTGGLWFVWIFIREMRRR